jgi:hypothetical protein
MPLKIVVTNSETNESTQAEGDYLVAVISSSPDSTTRRATVNCLVYGREPDHVEGMLVNLVVHLVRYAERTLGFLGFRELLLKAIEREAQMLGAYIRAG